MYASVWVSQYWPWELCILSPRGWKKANLLNISDRIQLYRSSQVYTRVIWVRLTTWRLLTVSFREGTREATTTGTNSKFSHLLKDIDDLKTSNPTVCQKRNASVSSGRYVSLSARASAWLYYLRLWGVLFYLFLSSSRWAMSNLHTTCTQGIFKHLPFVSGIDDDAFTTIDKESSL